MSYSNGPKIVTDGLVLCLDAGNSKSYPGTGTVWTDLSGNGNHGTLTNGPTYSGANNGSIVFDGVNDYINGIHNTQLDLTGDMTVECWFRITSIITNPSGSWVRIFGKGEGNIYRTFGLWYNLTVPNIFLYQRLGTSTMNALFYTSIFLNTWYHMAGRSSSNNHTLYINGVARATSSIGTTFYSNTDPYTIGFSTQPNNPLSHIGNVSNCKLYNRGLSEGEILQNYNATKARYGL